MKKIIFSALLMIILSIFLSCSPVEYTTAEIISVNASSEVQVGYLTEDNFIASGGQSVYQDKEVISEAEVLIKMIEIQQFYSEYNGKPLSTDNVEIDVFIYNYDFRTGEAKLSAEAIIPDPEGGKELYLNLVLHKRIQSDLVVYTYDETFTLNELQEHPDWFQWERDYSLRFYTIWDD